MTETATSTNSVGLQIKPDLENILRSDKVKEIMHKRISETLLGKYISILQFDIKSKIYPIVDKTYSTENVKVWTKLISDGINKDLCDAKNTRYKHVVQVVIVEKQGQGFKITSRARWDSECDRQVTESFTNDTMICVATVFGCYLY